MIVEFKIPTDTLSEALASSQRPTSAYGLAATQDGEDASLAIVADCAMSKPAEMATRVSVLIKRFLASTGDWP